MVNPINFPGPLSPVDPVKSAQKAGEAAPTEGKGFKSILLDSLNEVNKLQTEADRGVQRLITGETDNVAEVMAAVNKAGIAFDLLMEVRNKLTDAYQEIQQMRV